MLRYVSVRKHCANSGSYILIFLAATRSEAQVELPAAVAHDLNLSESLSGVSGFLLFVKYKCNLFYSQVNISLLKSPSSIVMPLSLALPRPRQPRRRSKSHSSHCGCFLLSSMGTGAIAECEDMNCLLAQHAKCLRPRLTSLHSRSPSTAGMRFPKANRFAC